MSELWCLRVPNGELQIATFELLRILRPPLALHTNPRDPVQDGRRRGALRRTSDPRANMEPQQRQPIVGNGASKKRAAHEANVGPQLSDDTDRAPGYRNMVDAAAAVNAVENGPASR